ncbi:MAG TPA: 1-deoxy-D-xylulose-5-phosphate reductoisomerase, partial [Dehalococcoidales bacterium]|nr:1-deoxy-D-xylulose-5-phosphate reductoisomerase [Dehalococcoidales bacterium]
MTDKVKRLAVLGSTGSIGTQTLDVVRAFPDRFKIVALAAGQNLKLLAQQIAEFKPTFVSHNTNGEMTRIAGANYRILPPEAIANLPQVDIVVIGSPGKAGLIPALAAARAGKNIALANKESLVMAGEIITAEAKQHSARILPIDGEHSAIWQCLNGETLPPASLILTASGGPFRSYSKTQLEKVTPEQALNHPSWKMGKKITIDSATLMNKGLEVIEAHWLFGMPFEKIKVLIHPQSIIHSMVEFADGSVKAQLSCPDMRLPIQYALSYPERLANPQLPKMDWAKLNNLTFELPDTDTFPCLKLAIEAGKRGGTYPAALCAADEAAVELFLARKIKFTGIARLVEQTLA